MSSKIVVSFHITSISFPDLVIDSILIKDRCVSLTFTKLQTLSPATRLPSLTLSPSSRVLSVFMILQQLQ